MKRPLAAVVLAAIGLLPSAGLAESTSAVTCSLTGDATAASAVTAVPSDNTLTLEGGLTCYKATFDGETVSGDTIAGDLLGSASGNAGCIVGSLSGEYEAAFPTGEGTRDVWIGNLGFAGGIINAAVVTIVSISHQTFDAELGEWVEDSSDGVGPGGTVGTLQLNVADPSICADAGFTSSVFDGRITGAFNQA